MTAIYATEKRKGARQALTEILCLILFVFVLFFGESVKEGVIYGFKICFFNIIPTLFPFFILSDLWNSVIRFRRDGVAEKFFEKIFGISGEAMSVFVLGNLCGFPLGIKSANEMYIKKSIDKSELEALCAISNNPSAAFVISGVGMGVFKSVRTGIILYFSVVASAVLVGIFFRRKTVKSQNNAENTRQSFDLVESIKSAGYSSIVVSSYIIFFSTIIGVFGKIINNRFVFSVVASFLEVGSACNIISVQSKSLGALCLPLISFALGFSGLSVFMQAFSFLPLDVSKAKYLFKKLLQGFVSALITLLLFAV